jgi:hypothetical protein
VDGYTLINAWKGRKEGRKGKSWLHEWRAAFAMNEQSDESEASWWTWTWTFD